MSEREDVEHRLPGDRFLKRINLIWASFFYSALAIALVAAFVADPGGLRGWALGAALALAAASAAIFQAFYWRVFIRLDVWPMPGRTALAYFGGQLLLLAALLALSDSFIALGFALMGQCFGVLRPRSWALALIPLLVLIVRPLGLFDDPAGVDWVGLTVFGLQLVIWMFAAGLLSLLFYQRYRLRALVEELRRARAQLEAALAQQEELAVLRERTRLAREMHDSLGHALVSVNVTLEAAQRLYRVDPARGDAELEATRALVRETMGALRRSIADLRAPLADHSDLTASLRRLAEEVSARGAVAVSVADGPGDLLRAPTVAEALFLIAREALANVERHARATRATLTLARDDGGWRLEVADDGVGVRPADLRRPGHFGIIGMRERASALGGALHVTPRPGGGTRVVATVPDPAARSL